MAIYILMTVQETGEILNEAKRDNIRIEIIYQLQTTKFCQKSQTVRHLIRRLWLQKLYVGYIVTAPSDSTRQRL